MKKLLTLLFSFGAATALAQAPAIQWQKCFGGITLDNANAIQQTTDGGYIVVGNAASIDGDVVGNHGAIDCWVIKLNGLGMIQWQRALGGSRSENGFSIQETTDGGYIVAGYSESTDGDLTNNNGGVDFWLLKLSNGGAVQWQKSLGGTGQDYARCVRQTADGGYIAAGYTNSNNGDVTNNHGDYDCWVVKLDNAGAVQWEKSHGGVGADFAHSIEQTTDGGYLVAGSSKSGNIAGNHGNEDFLVVKLDSTGVLQWQKCLGGSDWDIATSVLQTRDGSYILTGTTASNDGDIAGSHGNADCWIIKLDTTGALEWQKLMGGSSDDRAYSVQETIEGGYIIAGSSSSDNGDLTHNSGYHDFWIVKLNAAGTLQWQKSLGGSDEDESYSIHQTDDKGYIVAGFTMSNDGDVSGNHGYFDFWIVKLGPDPTAVSNVSPDASFSLYPNPARTEISLQSNEPIRSVAVMDMSGKKVAQISGNNASEMKIPTTGLASGTYFVRVETASGATTQKVLIAHK